MTRVEDNARLEATSAYEFPDFAEIAYLDAGFFVPLPRRSRETLLGFHSGALGIDVYHWRVLAEGAKSRLAAFHGVEGASLSYMRNTSEAMNAFVQALGPTQDDNVLVPEGDHPLTSLPWSQSRRGQPEVRYLPVNGASFADTVREAIDKNTVALSLSWVNSLTGRTMDLEVLGQLCAEKGVALCVDAVQGVGALPLDLRQHNVAMLACGAHKWLCGPHGVGYLYCNPEWTDRLSPKYVSAESFSRTGPEESVFHRDCRRFDLGNPNYGGILALDASISLLEDLGISLIASRVTSLASRLRSQLEALNLPFPGSVEATSGITSFAIPDAAGFADMCLGEGVRISVRHGLARVSTHFFNRPDQVDHVISLATSWRDSRPTGLTVA